MYYIYIIRSNRDGKFYTGLTSNLARRLDEHNKGKMSTRATYKKGPFELIHVELADNREVARKIEKFFKSGIGREVRDELLN